jgi:glycosyltransferase involved in cell wall biosynthesis
MSTTPVMSVALVTRNRPESLERTLSSLRDQDVQPFEVVVSDDSDPVSTGAIRELAERFDCSYIDGPRRGLYANRNRAALACAGSHVRTMDDDHEFPEGHVRTCLEAVTGDPAAIWIMGERLPGQSEADGLRCPPQLHPRGFSVTPRGSGPLWAISDGAAIYPRAVFDRGLRYTEEFAFGASYLEWGSRLRWLGYRIRHLDSTYVTHHYDPATRSYDESGIDLASRFFAMFAHSLLYQPTIRNRLLCTVEVTRQVFVGGPVARQAARSGWRVYRHHRDEIAGDRIAQLAEART